MQTFTVYGPTANGSTAYGPIAGGMVAYGTSTSGVTQPPATGYPMTYPEILDYVTFQINEGTPENIIDIITPEHVAIIQQCGVVTNPNGANDTNILTPIDDQIDTLLDELSEVASVGDALAMFNSTNAGAADLYASQTDRVGEYEGITSTDADVAEVLLLLDEITIIKIDAPC